MNGPDPLTLPNLPRDETGPVFAEPWQAQAFALVLQLHERGAFTWPEWAEALSRRLKATPDADGAQYYDRWLEGRHPDRLRRNHLRQKERIFKYLMRSGPVSPCPLHPDAPYRRIADLASRLARASALA